MARYICSYVVKISLDELHNSLISLLENCDFSVTYNHQEYIMARENPGQIHFTKLVNVEVLIDTTTATPERMKFDLVVKNDELLLHANNHCEQKFEFIKSEIATNYQWETNS